jgi:cytosine/adenosine deaminase-related metal-dependent hydrolase
MVRIALAPCSPFSVTPDLMRRTAELAERLDVRLHTHLAEDADEDSFALERSGRRTVDHFAGVGVAHCPSSNMMIGGGGLAPVAELRAAGVPVGLGCDGSASTDHASLWLEGRTALMQGRVRHGPASMTARHALEIATRGSAGCLGRTGELGQLWVGAIGDLVGWPLEGFAFAGALTDPVEAWLRCGPVSARHTVVAGRPVVLDGQLVATGSSDILSRHAKAAARLAGNRQLTRQSLVME